MAFTMSGEVQLNATKETVYAKLNDPAVLKACIPGCEELDMISPTEFVAVSVIKIGPVKAKMKGKWDFFEVVRASPGANQPLMALQPTAEENACNMG